MVARKIIGMILLLFLFSVSFPADPGIRFAERFPGANAGLKVHAAMLSLQNAGIQGGIVDGTALTGDQTSTVNPFTGITVPIVWRMGAGTLTTDSTIWFGQGNSQIIKGIGTRGTTIKGSATLPADSAVVRIGKYLGSFGSYLTGIQIDANGHKYGLDLAGSQENSGAWNFTSHNAIRYAIWFHDGFGLGATQNTGIDNFETSVVTDTAIGVMIDAAATGRIYITNGTINTDYVAIQRKGIEMAATTASVFVSNVHVENAKDGVRKSAAGILSVDGLLGHSTVDTLVKIESGISSYTLKNIDVNGGPLGWYDATPNAQKISGSIVGPLTREGVATPYLWGPSVGLVISPPAGTNQGLSINLGSGTTGTNSAINIANPDRTIFRVQKNGKVGFAGYTIINGGTTLDSLMGWLVHSNTDQRTWSFPDISGEVLLKRDTLFFLTSGMSWFKYASGTIGTESNLVLLSQLASATFRRTGTGNNLDATFGISTPGGAQRFTIDITDGASTGEPLYLQTSGGDVNVSGIIAATKAAYTANSTIASTDIDWNSSNSFSKTISGNTTFTFSHTKDGQTINIAVTASGSFTTTWPTVTWQGGAAPTQTPSKTDIYSFWKVGSTIYGMANQNF